MHIIKKPRHGWIQGLTLCYQEIVLDYFSALISFVLASFSSRFSPSGEKMTTIIPMLIFYQVSRTEHHILKVPITWLAPHDPITVARAQTTPIGTRG